MREAQSDLVLQNHDIWILPTLSSASGFQFLHMLSAEVLALPSKVFKYDTIKQL